MNYSKKNSRLTIESLYVMFMLYSEFKNSHHFKAMNHIHETYTLI